MKLEFEMIPDGCWYSNLRTLLKPFMWDILRKDAYERAGGKCMICACKPKRLEAHERWAFDEHKKMQTLVDIIAVCHLCHSVIHIGRTLLVEGEERASAHYMKVNKCSYADYRKALGKANDRHRELNKVDEWQLDLTYLKKIIGNIDI